MSCNRDNVTWQSADKTWNAGFFSFTSFNTDSEDFDYEWDVDYNYDSFWFVTKGHKTPEAAQAAYTYDHMNPGGTTYVHYAGNSADCKKYDRMAWVFLNPELARLEAEKIQRAAMRAHTRKLSTEVAGDSNLTNPHIKINITFKSDTSTMWGQSENLTGYPRLNGNWLTVEGHRYFNPSTGKVAPNVYSAKRAVDRRW